MAVTWVLWLRGYVGNCCIALKVEELWIDYLTTSPLSAIGHRRLGFFQTPTQAIVHHRL